MYNYILDVFIWSFAIYGMFCFSKEYFLEVLSYFIIKCIYVYELYRKHIDKITR